MTNCGLWLRVVHSFHLVKKVLPEAESLWLKVTIRTEWLWLIMRVIGTLDTFDMIWYYLSLSNDLGKNLSSGPTSHRVTRLTSTLEIILCLYLRIPALHIWKYMLPYNYLSKKHELPPKKNFI